MAQVRSHHPQPQPPLHPVLPVESAFVPAIIATQTRDSALHARTPPIAAPKSSGMLKSLAFSRELARSRNGHQPDACFRESGLCLRRVNPSISGEQSRRMFKKRLMVLHSLDSLPMLVGVGQDLITRHYACLDLIEDDLPTKLDERASFMPRNGAGVWLEQTEHFLLGRNFLAFEYTAACLYDHALNQRKHGLGLLQESFCLLLALLAKCLYDFTCLLYHLFGRLYQFLI